MHGDCWNNNTLWDRAADGSIGDEIVALVDWQTMFCGSPLFDLARFLVCAADGDVRRRLERRAIEIFYSQLTNHHQKQDSNPKFSLEDVSSESNIL